MRLLYAIGFGYLFLTSAALIGHRPAEPRAPRPARPRATCKATQWGSQPAKDWYCAVKASCNRLEVTERLQQTPPPEGWDGHGYAAACFALAGHTDRARAQLEAAPASHRGRAAAILFEIGHPVADRGDDVSAGPIMDLVLEFWPENYQALYHAGMSDYALGHADRAVPKLEQFLRLYPNRDFFGNNAREALGRIERGEGPAKTSPGAH